MPFPTIPDPSSIPLVENPCSHVFPYDVLDNGRIDTHPCEKCGTSWADRNQDWPNAFVTWSLPKEATFGYPVIPSTFLPAEDPEDAEMDPGWFNWR